MNLAPKSANLNPALTVNLTHQVVVGKALPNSPIPEALKNMGDEHKQFVERARQDSTKTDVKKELMVRQDANNRINGLFKSIDTAYQAAHGQVAELENIISQQWEIKGTTDFLILQNQAQVLQNLKYSEVAKLVESGDINTLRCLQLPVMQHQFKLNEPKYKAGLSQMKEAHLLNSQQNDLLNQSRSAVDAVSSMGEGLMNQLTSNNKVISNIKSSMVEVAQ